jgi:zinc transport system substrate-binding protein
MEKAFNAIPSNVVKVPVAEKARLKLLPYREGGPWEEDKHEGHDHGHEGHHDEGGGDMHVWLDPDNAIKMIKAITRQLSKVYPENRDTYKANARSYVQKITALDSELSATLSNSKESPFIVFHDAYQYFEKHYGLNGVGSITFDPHDFPSPKRLKEIRSKLNATSAACVFSEPQFSDRLVRTVIKGTSAKTALIDPLGSSIENGPDLYFTLLKNMADTFKSCLNS